MNQAPVGKSPVYFCTPLYLCTSDPTPKPRYIPKPPKQQQRPYKTGQIVRTRHHISQPVQSEHTRPLTPPLNYRPRAAIKTHAPKPSTVKIHTPQDQGAEVKQRFQAQHPKYQENNLLEQQAELERYTATLITRCDLIELLEQQAELQRYQPPNKHQTVRDRILALY